MQAVHFVNLAERMQPELHWVQPKGRRTQLQPVVEPQFIIGIQDTAQLALDGAPAQLERNVYPDVASSHSL
jgi:hypothetical protein